MALPQILAVVEQVLTDGVSDLIVICPCLIRFHRTRVIMLARFLVQKLAAAAQACGAGQPQKKCVSPNT